MGEFKPTGPASCRCKGAEEIHLDVSQFSFRGVDLPVGGTVLVPCPWCKPSEYWAKDRWETCEPLFAALDALPDWVFRRKG